MAQRESAGACDRNSARTRTGRGAAARLLAATAVLAGSPVLGEAQLSSATVGRMAVSDGPRVFLDCQGRIPCDRTHFRTEIQFVNWAQDREDSDVHVIATSEQVGGGGWQYTLDFIGRGPMADLSDRLTYTSAGTDVEAETIDGLTQTLRLGLMRYAIESGLGQAFAVSFTEGGSQLTAAGQGTDGEEEARRSDPWNYWTFRVELSGDMDIEETLRETRINPSIAADRVSEDWKLGFELDVDFQRESLELTDGREVRDDRDDWFLDGLIVRSVSDHFSAGMSFGGSNSIRDNQDARVSFAPALEYNYFPYAEANRRQLTLQYAAGFEHSNYIEETLFNALEETRPQHEMRLSYDAREQWGSAGVGVNYSQYLDDAGLYRIGLNGDLNLRITRGLDLNIDGYASSVKDQIYIPLSDISDEDILLGRQNLPSGYEYGASIGLGYRWGSTFTNIVNTRFGSGNGNWN